MIDSIEKELISTLADAFPSPSTVKVSAEYQNMPVPCIGVFWLGLGQIVIHEVQPYRAYRYELSFYAEAGNGAEGMAKLRAMTETAVDALFAKPSLGLSNVHRIELEGQSMSKPGMVDKAICIRVPLTVVLHE